MKDPILIDECLSPDLAAYAQSRGYHATHVVHRGRDSTKDWALMPIIRQEGFIFATGNAKDFLKLYATEDVHPGLIFVIHGNGTAEVQVELFGKALDAAEKLPDLTNTLVEVFEDGRVSISDYPPADEASSPP